LLVAAGADINIANNYDNSCLMIAGFRGHADVVRFLLEKGADPDVSAKCGATALHFAASDGHLGVVRALGDANANLTRNVNGMTPLFTAAERCQADIVEFIAKNWRHQVILLLLFNLSILPY
jgi:Fem-1 family protein b